MCALLVLLSCRNFASAPAPRALALEGIVIAAIELQLALVEMHDMVADVVEQIAVVADDDDRRRIASRDSRPARACLRDRDNWSARRAAAGRARRTARRRARRACASRRRIPTGPRSAPHRRSRGPARIAAGARRRGMRARCRRGGSGFRRCGAGRARFRPRPAARRARDRRRARNRSAAVGPPGASCSTRPSFAPRRNVDRAVLGGDFAGDQRGTAWSCRRRCGREADAGAVGKERAGVVEQEPVAEPVGEAADCEHFP